MSFSTVSIEYITFRCRCRNFFASICIIVIDFVGKRCGAHSSCLVSPYCSHPPHIQHLRNTSTSQPPPYTILHNNQPLSVFMLTFQISAALWCGLCVALRDGTTWIHRYMYIYLQSLLWCRLNCNACTFAHSSLSLSVIFSVYVFICPLHSFESSCARVLSVNPHKHRSQFASAAA